MKKVTSIEEHKAKNIPRADAILVPMYNELADLELRVRIMRGEVAKKERELLPEREAVHRLLMRRADKIDW